MNHKAVEQALAEKTDGSNIYDAVRGYIRRGWAPVPIPRGKKAPRVKDWPRLRVAEAEVQSYFREEDNVGFLLGEPSGGLVDVDLDAPQAVASAQVFLPPTERRHGRKSHPGSHAWYIADPVPKPEKFADLDGTCLVELRSTGQQTVVPPSVHPSGEPIIWEEKGEPAIINGRLLRTGVARLAACVLVARHWPTPGTRHAAALALAGLLLRSGWSEDDAIAFVSAVAEAAHDEEWRARKADVRSTARRLAEGRAATGLPRLAEFLGDRVVGRLCDWQGLCSATNANTANPGPYQPVATQDGGTEEIREAPSSEVRKCDLRQEIRQIILAPNSDIQPFDKRRKVLDAIRRDLVAAGKFYRTPDSEVFYFTDAQSRLLNLDGADFQRFIQNRAGLSATEQQFKFAMDMLRAETAETADLAEVHTLSHYDKISGALYISDQAGGVWYWDGKGWTRGHNGESGVLFFTEIGAERIEPVFGGDGQDFRWFLSIPNFCDDLLLAAEQRSLYTVFLLSRMFSTLHRTKPIPLLLGPQGAGKTLTARALGILLVGPGFDVSGFRRDREDHFVAAICNGTVAVWDNADARISWLEDALARYATGEVFRMRRLYTTNEEVRYRPRAVLMLTSRDPHFRRADVAERLMPLTLGRLEQFIPEQRMLSDLRERRPRIWGDLFSHAAETARAIQAAPDPGPLCFRLADLADFGWRIYAAKGEEQRWIHLMKKLERAQARYAAESNGLILALAEVLAASTDETIGTTELFHKLSGVSDRDGLRIPNSAISLGRQLAALRQVIKLELGVDVEQLRDGRSRMWRFKKVSVGHPSVPSETLATR
jgi:hypothetical protein